MPTPPFQIVAVDVSKDSLQIKTDSDSFAVAATPEGLAKLRGENTPVIIERWYETISCK